MKQEHAHNEERTLKVAVVGGGPAGMCAAIAAARRGCDVTIYEQNEKLGKKLYITGKGRCNLTNFCDKDTFFENIVRNPRFLFSAYAAFSQQDLMDLIEEAGCPLKVERGNRVFPVSDKSSDIIKAFSKTIDMEGVSVKYHTKIAEILTERMEDDSRKVIGLRSQSGEIFYADHIILATGGGSFTSTGSDGSGFHLSQATGHRLVPLRPSLVGLHTVEDWPRDLQGLSLRNVSLTLKKGTKKIHREQGEMLFTHFGLSGPLVLTASAFMTEVPQNYTLEIDLKPALTEEQIHLRVMRDFEKYQNKHIENGLSDLLPKSMIPVIIMLSEIDPVKPIHQINKKERQRLECLLKKLTCTIADFAPMDTAIVTAGGVNVRDIDPKNMHSKVIEGLSFAGEMIDIDALTGGFNIQIASSTGWLAGNNL